jgi:serine/threonine protein phosphatase PrpC
LEDDILTKELLNEALTKAYRALDEQDNGALRKMGTTFTFIGLHAGGCLAAHIGDSRIYQIRPGKGLLYQSADHSLVNDLLKTGEITVEEAIGHPQKSVLTRVMQPCLEQPYKAEMHQLYDIQSGDYFFLCSDGVLEQLTNEQLLSILSDATLSDKEKVEKLEAVSRGKTKDNYTAYLIPIDQVELEANDRTSSEDNNIVMATAIPSPPLYNLPLDIRKNKKKRRIKQLCIGLCVVIVACAVFYLILLKYFPSPNTIQTVSIVTRGFIDKNGHEVIPFRYDKAGSFREGLAIVELNGKYGFIDKNGKEVIPLKYDEVGDFIEDLAVVLLNGKHGL